MNWFCAVRTYIPDPFVFVATLILAVITWRLVVRTQDLARDSLVAASFADKAHQEQLMPVCHMVGTVRMAFVGVDGNGQEIRFGDVAESKHSQLRHSKTYQRVEGILRNDGPGTAINISFQVAIARLNGSPVWQAFPVGALAPSAQMPFAYEFQSWPAAEPHTMFEGWAFQIIAHNIFQQAAITIHAGAFLGGSVVNIDSTGFAFEPPKALERLAALDLRDLPNPATEATGPQKSASP